MHQTWKSYKTPFRRPSRKCQWCSTAAIVGIIGFACIFLPTSYEPIALQKQPHLLNNNLTELYMFEPYAITFQVIQLASKNSSHIYEQYKYIDCIHSVCGYTVTLLLWQYIIIIIYAPHI